MARLTAEDARRKIERAAGLFRQAAEPTRLRILLALAEADGECQARGLRERLGLGDGISHHLALLRHGGLITVRRGRGDAYYRLSETGRMLVKVVEAVV